MVNRTMDRWKSRAKSSWIKGGEMYKLYGDHEDSVDQNFGFDFISPPKWTKHMSEKHEIVQDTS